MKGWRKIVHANRNQKRTAVSTLTSDKMDFKYRLVIRGKECHFLMIKLSIQKEKRKIIHIYVPDIKAH